MEKFRYPLARLKHLRERELHHAADELRRITMESNAIKTKVSERASAIRDAQRQMLTMEAETGAIQPDMRKRTALFVQAVQLEREQLEAVLREFELKLQQAFAELLEKKRSVKTLENHEERKSSEFQFTVQCRELKHDDELWLTRQHDKSLATEPR